MTEENTFLKLNNVDVTCKRENNEIKDVISIRMKFDDGQTAYLEKNKEGTFKLTWRHHKNT